MLADPGVELLVEVGVGFNAGVEGDEGVDRLSLDVVGDGDDRGLGDMLVGDERAFDLGGADAVARDVDDVVNPAGDPVIAVLVAAAAIAGEVEPGVSGEIGLEEALVVAPHAAHLAGPGRAQAEVTGGRAVELAALSVDEQGLDAGERAGGATGLHVHRAGEVGDEDAAGLGLPPGVGDRAALVADDAPIPVPRLGVDRLADGAEEAERSAAVLRDPVVAFAHQRADRGRGGVEDGDAEPVDRLPQAAVVGVVGNAVEHHAGRAVHQRAVDGVAVAGDPADIGGAPEDVVVAHAEDPVEGGRGPGGVAAGGVDHALGLAGRARGVEDEQRVLGVHRFGRAVGGDGVAKGGPGKVAAIGHRHVGAGALDDQDGVDRADAKRLVDIGFERDRLAATAALVGGDDRDRAAILDPVGEAFGAEAAEHDRVDRADPRAGEHRRRRFGDHRQVDHHAVAALDAARLERVGEAARLFVELAVGQRAALAGLVSLEDQRGAVAALGKVPVEAVDREIELAVLIPADAEVVGAERPVASLGGQAAPLEPPRLVEPEGVGIGSERGVKRGEFGFADAGAEAGGDGDDGFTHGTGAPVRQCRPS